MKTARRFFWGNSLPQAIMSAARHHGVDPTWLDFRIHQKRHGFVKHPRTVVIEVDPGHPRREAAPDGGGSVLEVPLPDARPSPPRPAHPRATPPARERSARPEAVPARRRAAADRPRPARPPEEAWEAPNEDSAVAAVAAMRALLRLAGLDLEPQVTLGEDRIDVDLASQDSGSLVAAGGLALLEDFDTLLPKAIRTLSGRSVRTRTEGDGLRAHRQEELLRRARETAARVAATGAAEELPGMTAAERRAVHMELALHPEVQTESVGAGSRRHLVVRPRRSDHP
ncbi:MAG: R3H domain-containing nucleic acid-binding protein [Thermoanaerobaculia bacterium]